MIIRLKGDEKLSVVDVNKKEQSRKPEVPYGYELPLTLVFYHDDGSDYNEAELSAFISFQFAMDKDFNFSTDPTVLANNSTTSFVISGNTVSFTIMTDTAPLKAHLGDEPTINYYAEFKAYKPGKIRPGLGPVFPIKVRNAVAADGSAEPSASPELYITYAEAYALMGDYPSCYPVASDPPLTFTKADVDSETKLYRVTHDLGQKWALGVRIDSELTGKPIEFDDIIPVDENNLDIDCTNKYDDMSGNYYLRVKK